MPINRTKAISHPTVSLFMAVHPIRLDKDFDSRAPGEVQARR
jgi:hypothetical protein